MVRRQNPFNSDLSQYDGMVASLQLEFIWFSERALRIGSDCSQQAPEAAKVHLYQQPSSILLCLLLSSQAGMHALM